MNTLRELLKKNRHLHNFGKWIRRVIFKSRYLYFLSNSTKPLSDQYGFDRGIPLDRFFIEDFLNKHRSDIKGNCLEILNNEYTIKYGGINVTKCDILDIDKKNGSATIIDDLRNLKKIDDNTYDTIILTQVLQFIDDLESAISECHRVLAPNGTMLVTLPSISRADCASGVDGDFWRFTQASAKYLFERNFDSSALQIDFYGNIRSGIYFYSGLAMEDTSKNILLDKDENFPTIITVRARKQ